MSKPATPVPEPVHGPIGVFDSGLGGLAVLRALREALPGADLIYVADSAHAPYGERDADFIIERSEHIARFLLARGAGALLVACNTATAVAVGALRGWCPVPVVAMEPAIKPAAALTRSGRIAVLATRQTVASDKVARLVAEHGARCAIELIACPGLVECVERGEVSTPSTRELVETYLRPALQRGADCVVLGCTHYSFLRPLIEELAGAQAQLLDPAPAVVRELLRRIGAGANAVSQHSGSERFYTSAPSETAAPLISMLWGKKVAVEGF